MKTTTHLKAALFCIVMSLFFSCKNTSTSTDRDTDYKVNSADTTSENSKAPADTASVKQDSINGTTPTGSNERGQ